VKANVAAAPADLLDMGFEYELSARALEVADNKPDTAANLILSGTVV